MNLIRFQIKNYLHHNLIRKQAGFATGAIVPGWTIADVFGFYPEKLSQWIVENVIIQKK